MMRGTSEHCNKSPAAMLWPALLAAMCLMFTARWGLSAVAQTGSVTDLKEHYGLIVRYAESDAGVVARLRSWNRERMSDAVALINGPQDPFAPWESWRLRTGAMMHTEAALQCLRENDDECTAFHLRLGVRMLAKGASDVGTFAGRWVAAVSTYLGTLGEFQAATDLLKFARERLPGHSVILYRSGVIEETVAALPPPRIPSIDTDPDGIRIESLRQQRMRHLATAAGWLLESIRLDGANVAARIHHARIQTLLGNERTALSELAGLRMKVSAPGDAYLVALFSAAAHERIGEWPQAADQYRSALQHYPQGQAAYLGLAALSEKTGKTEEANSVLNELWQHDSTNARDPWASYFHAPFEHVAGEILQLRREAIR
jgi:thioredoxin-like negative regulator of GroEL